MALACEIRLHVERLRVLTKNMDIWHKCINNISDEDVIQDITISIFLPQHSTGGSLSKAKMFKLPVQAELL